MTGRNIGVLVGPVLLAQAFKLTDDWTLASPIFGTITTFCLFASLLLMRRLPQSVMDNRNIPPQSTPGEST